MTTIASSHKFEKYIPVLGDLNYKTPLAYQVTRGVVRLFNGMQMAIAHSYINGLEIPDSVMAGLFNTCLPPLYRHFPSLLVPYPWILKETEHLAEGSQQLMKIQYDLPEPLFTLMLGEGKLMYPKYTMALWEKGATTLEQAQIDMLEDAVEKAQIQDGDEILDLGCGFGSASHYILAKFPNAKVTAVNLSKVQCNYMRKKIQDPESYLSSDRFTLCEADFNDINFEKKFDKIIAIGLFEHVGNLTNSFKKIASFLKENGKIFIHIISTRLPHNMFSVFINEYIFPNARVWDYDQVPLHNKDIKTLNRWYINGSNYAKTLKAWLDNFDRHQEQIKTLNYGMDYAKFRRIWRLYLLWCIAYFSACNGEMLGNGQYLLSR
jgi:cyclopropane-fatty-acyl-phospholipid synthase